MRTAAWVGGIALFMTGSPGVAQVVREAGGTVQVDPPTSVQAPPMITPAGGDTVRVGASATPATGQGSRIAGGSVKFHPNREKKELAVDFRLVDPLTVTAVQAVAENGGSVPAKWAGWELPKSPACAWVIVVDTSVTSPAKTLGHYVDFVRAFVSQLPKQDSVAVCTMAGELKEVVPFDSAADEIAKGLTGVKRADGTTSTTLIFARLRDTLERLAERKETRRALLVLTNGQDQTEGGPEAQDLEIKKLVDAANSAGVVIHALGSAENVAARKYFAVLKDLAARTEGVFEAPAFGGEELPFGAMGHLRSVMHGAGTVRLDLSKLTKATDITVTVKTAGGRSADLPIPAAKVAEILGAAPPPANDPAKETPPKKAAQETAGKADSPATPLPTDAVKTPADKPNNPAAEQPAKETTAEPAKEPGKEPGKEPAKEPATSPVTDKPVTAAQPEKPAVAAKPALPSVMGYPFKTWVLAAAGALVLLLMVSLALFLLLRKRP